MNLSRTDRRLLNELQRDATRKQSELAELTGAEAFRGPLCELDLRIAQG